MKYITAFWGILFSTLIESGNSWLCRVLWNKLVVDTQGGCGRGSFRFPCWGSRTSSGPSSPRKMLVFPDARPGLAEQNLSSGTSVIRSSAWTSERCISISRSACVSRTYSSPREYERVPQLGQWSFIRAAFLDILHSWPLHTSPK